MWLRVLCFHVSRFYLSLLGRILQIGEGFSDLSDFLLGSHLRQ